MTTAAQGSPRRAQAVRVFLIADIRGYTRFTAQEGDEAASRLVARFAEIVGEGIEAWGGELVELRGDESLAVFDSARQALRCAVELQSAFADETRMDPSMPLRVGIGLDVGDAVPVGDGYRGAALNLAARLCGAAAGGEILASATVVGLVGTVPGISIGPLEPRTLKGLETPVEAAAIAEEAAADQQAPAPATERSQTVASSPETIEPEAAASTDGGRVARRSLPAELEPAVPLIGRTADLRWLRWHWRRARRGHGRTVIVSGQPGIGKTRLAAELASGAFTEGAWVSYLAAGTWVDTGRVVGPRAGVLVVDDLDASPLPIQQAVGALARRLDGGTTLLLVIHREAAADTLQRVTDRFAPAERRRTLGPLGPDEVRAIAALYAGAEAEQAPIRRLMDDSSGVPAAVHRAASRWARSVASSRLASAAARTEAGRHDLRAAQDELIGDVAALERISGRSRRFGSEADADDHDRVTICPYKGLASFDAVDAEYYFGREGLIAELVAKLVGNPFLGFVGVSGSGKSSAILAGLLPALAGGVLPGSERWIQVLMRPGEHPLDELRRALARTIPDRSADGRAAPDVAASAVRAAAPDPIDDALGRLEGDQGLVLAIDQFEEIFSATRDEAERGAFIDLLTEARPGVRIVVTLRADHYGRCADYPSLARMISATHVLVGPLRMAELEAVIEAPAERVGLRVEPALLRALVDDAGSEPGVLPLLSTALLELWQARSGGWLTLEAYRAGGGLHGAIARLAETAYAELDPGQATLARSMFLRLAGPGDGEAVVRRRVSIDEIGLEDPAVERVFERLTAARIITTGDGYVEVIHEALLREWPRLREWLEEDAEGRKIRLHLIGAARDWDERGHQAADLYRGARLSTALDWAAEHAAELNPTERAFLEASRISSERVVERERRTNRRLRGLLAGSAALLLVAVVAGAIALVQGDAARRQATLARSRELAASAASVLGDDPALARALAVSAADLDPTGLDIETMLHRAYAADRTLARWTVPDEGAGSPQVALAPDGHRMAAIWGPTGSYPDHLAVIDLATGSTLWSISPKLPQVRLAIRPVFSRDGSRVYIGLLWAPANDQGAGPPANTLGIVAYDTATGAQLERIDTGPCGAAVAEGGDGTLLIGTVPANIPHPEDCFAQPATSPPVPRPLEAVDVRTGARSLLSTDILRQGAISANGRVAAFTDVPASETIVRDLTTGKDLLTLSTDPSKIGQAETYVRALNEDGSLLLYGDRPPKVFDVATGDEVASLDPGAGDHPGATFGPDGKVYLSGGDASLSAWDPWAGTRLVELPAAGGGGVVVIPEGRVLVQDIASRSARLLDPKAHGEAGAVASCAGFTPAFQLAVAGGLGVFTTYCDDGSRPLHIVDMDRLKVSSTIPGSDGQQVALSADGARVAVATSSPALIMGPVRVFDTRSGQPIATMSGLCSWDSSGQNPPRDDPGCRSYPDTPFPLWPERLTFSPDGRYLAAVGDQTELVVWDAATGRILLVTSKIHAHLGLIFTPDSSEMLVATADCQLVAFSTATWAIDRQVALPQSVDDCAWTDLVGFAADGTLIAMTGAQAAGGGWLYRIDPQTFEVLTSWRAHDAAPKSEAMNARGTLIATGDSNGIVRVWDAASGALQHQMSVDGQAQGVAFLGDDRLVVAPSGGGLLVFELDPSRLLQTVRAGITRTFTAEECQRYHFDPCPTLDELRGSTP